MKRYQLELNPLQENINQFSTQKQRGRSSNLDFDHEQIINGVTPDLRRIGASSPQKNLKLESSKSKPGVDETPLHQKKNGNQNAFLLDFKTNKKRARSKTSLQKYSAVSKTLSKVPVVKKEWELIEVLARYFKLKTEIPSTVIKVEKLFASTSYLTIVLFVYWFSTHLRRDDSNWVSLNTLYLNYTHFIKDFRQPPCSRVRVKNALKILSDEPQIVLNTATAQEPFKSIHLKRYPEGWKIKGLKLSN